MGKPPPKNKPNGKPMTAKRQKILELAMAQLKKTRAQIDPKVLGKIRSIIASNPNVMKGLGLNEMPIGGAGSKAPVENKLSTKAKQVPVPENKPEKIGSKKGVDESRLEKIDPVHNQEVIAKLMKLKPTEIENIKAVLLKDKD